jgi:multiple sugar transport system permease protein
MAAPRATRGRTVERLAGLAGLYAVLAAGSLLMIVPFLYLLLTSLKPRTELAIYPPRLLPIVWRPENYSDVWRAGHFSGYFVNSTVVAVLHALLVILVAALAAYPFARIQFPGRRAAFLLVLSTLMVPPQVTLIPLFVLVKRMPLAGGNDLLGAGGTGLLNSYAGLIVPGLVSPFAIFMLTQFFSTLPSDLDDAARIDGASELGIFWRIILPLSRPALAALAILTFQGSWNSFIWPLLVAQKPDMWTLPVALAQFQTEFGAQEWSLLMAGTVISIAPLVLVFCAAQRHFIRGVAITGMK